MPTPFLPSRAVLLTVLLALGQTVAPNATTSAPKVTGSADLRPQPGSACRWNAVCLLRRTVECRPVGTEDLVLTLVEASLAKPPEADRTKLHFEVLKLFSEQLGSGGDQRFVPVPFLAPSHEDDVLSARLWIKIAVQMQGQAGALLGRQIGEEPAIYFAPVNRDGERDFWTPLVVLELRIVL